MNYNISKEIEFDAGHRVPMHASKCKNPHGHRYRVVAHLSGELITEGPESGMVKDFGHVKTAMMELVHDVYDHGFIVHREDARMCKALGMYDSDRLGKVSAYGWKVVVVDFVPTAECLAREFFDTLKKAVPNLTSVDVWETPTSCASYREVSVEYVDG